MTRWLPREIAAGVSDPEILDVLEERGNFTLTLVDNLHAKIYVADENCLVGSSNVTLSGTRGKRQMRLMLKSWSLQPFTILELRSHSLKWLSLNVWRHVYMQKQLVNLLIAFRQNLT